MAAVKGQIRVAEDTLARGQPTLGLCLGMQSMMTAVVRRRPGCESAIPAEVAPDEALHSFVPLLMAVIAAAYSLFLRVDPR
ncbi:hypothetical protein LNO81_10765 [Klebsiella variicola subsp. variicola]|nr:hypothetical protein [Klebsiella variicola subsp. variicola]